MTTLVEIFEEDYFMLVMKWSFLPFCVYFLSTVYFFSHNVIDVTYRDSLLSGESSYTSNSLSLEFLTKNITIFGMLYFTFIEISQIMQHRVNYWDDFWNFLDLISIILNTILLFDLFNTQKIDIDNTRVITFVAVFILWGKLIYWFRLFTPTAFYIKLIIETLKNVGWFLLIYVAVLLAFANAIYILNKNRTQPDYTCDEQ